MAQAKQVTAQLESITQAKETLAGKYQEAQVRKKAWLKICIDCFFLQAELDLLRILRDEHSVTLVSFEKLKQANQTLQNDLNIHSLLPSASHCF